MESVLDLLYKVTGGQIGQLSGILSILKGKLTPEERNATDTAGFARWVHSFVFSVAFLTSCDGMMRGLPQVNDLSPDMISVMDMVLQNQNSLSVSIIKSSPVIVQQALDILISYGFLYVDGDYNVSFSSFLAGFVYYRHRYYPIDHRPRPVTAPSVHAGIDHFILDVLKGFSQSSLRDTWSASINGTVYERLYQMEFYKSATRLMGKNTMVFPDVGAVFGVGGYVDFIVNSVYGYAIELLREGDELTEHINRFKENGRYYRLLELNIIKQWMVLDFRSIHKQIKLVHPNLTTIHYTDDYSQFIIYNNNNKIATIQL
jgi:hypothetical protein